MYAKNLFAGKTALVTGGATGIGYAISKSLYSLGANVVVASRNEKNLKNAVESLKRDVSQTTDNTLRYSICNQRELANCKDTIEEIIGTEGQLDFLVANWVN